MHGCIYTCMHECMYVCLCVCICLFVYVYVYLYECVCVCTTLTFCFSPFLASFRSFHLISPNLSFPLSPPSVPPPLSSSSAGSVPPPPPPAPCPPPSALDTRAGHRTAPLALPPAAQGVSRCTRIAAKDLQQDGGRGRRINATHDRPSRHSATRHSRVALQRLASLAGRRDGDERRAAAGPKLISPRRQMLGREGGRKSGGRDGGKKTKENGPNHLQRCNRNSSLTVGERLNPQEIHHA